MATAITAAISLVNGYSHKQTYAKENAMLWQSMLSSFMPQPFLIACEDGVEKFDPSKIPLLPAKFFIDTGITKETPEMAATADTTIFFWQQYHGALNNQVQVWASYKNIGNP